MEPLPALKTPTGFNRQYNLRGIEFPPSMALAVPVMFLNKERVAG
jgi:hypothetical protein